MGDISYWDNKERKEKLNQSYDDSVMQSHIRLMYAINKKTEGEAYVEDWEDEYFEDSSGDVLNPFEGEKRTKEELFS